jgi:leader peptidase (prepilin peptidase)/N-methyltransferase
MDPITEWTLRLGWILPVWLFALGGTIGSFLNVVVYRLPAGKSIVHPGSHCPACGHPIRWYHNLPVLSWIVLGGRCYECRAKISSRYPIVEAIVAILFVVLFGVDVWLPLHPNPMKFTGTMPSGIDLAARYFGDLWLTCSLLCAALIEIDRQRVPRRILALAIAVGLAVAAAFPAARTGLIVHLLREETAAPWIGGLADSLTGAAAGALVGIVMQMSSLRLVMAGRGKVGNAPGGIESMALEMATIGAFLGWTGAIVTGIAATIALGLMRNLSRDESAVARLGWSALAWAAALAWIIALPRFVSQ